MTRLRRLFLQWEGFWFSEDTSRTLGLVRLLMGTVFILKFTRLYGLYRFPNYRLEIPRHEFARKSVYHLSENLFHAPYGFFDWLPLPSFDTFQTIELTLLVLAIPFTLGLFHRFLAPVLLAIYAYWFGLSQFLYHHNGFQFLIVLGILSFSRSADHWSLDSWIRRKRGNLPSPKSILPLRMLQVLVTLIYTFTFLSKCNEGWRTGKILQLIDESGGFYGPLRPWIPEAISYQFLSLTTVLAEGFLAFAFWFPRLRWVALCVGVALHLGIDLIVRVQTFSYQMMVLYTVFFFDVCLRGHPFSSRCPKGSEYREPGIAS